MVMKSVAGKEATVAMLRKSHLVKPTKDDKGNKILAVFNTKRPQLEGLWKKYKAVSPHACLKLQEAAVQDASSITVDLLPGSESSDEESDDARR